MGLAALANGAALSKRNDDPAHCLRPFDATRDGFVLGEAPGSSSCESLAHAWPLAAAPIAAEIGGAPTAAAFHISAPDPSGRGQTRAMTNARRNLASRPTRSTTSSPMARRPSSTTRPETKAIKGALRRACLQGRHQLTEVDDRPIRRRGRHRIGTGRLRLDPRQGTSADGEPAHARSRCDLDYVPLVASPGDRDGRGQRLRASVARMR